MKSEGSLIVAVKDFWRAQPWTTIDDNQIFRIRDRETGLEGWCSVMGSGGQEYGIGICLGRDEGYSLLRRVIEGKTDKDAFGYELDGIMLSFTPDSELPSGWPREHLIANIRSGGRAIRAIGWRKHPGKVPRRPDTKESEFLNRALRAIVKMYMAGKMTPDWLDPGEDIHLTCELSGSLKNLRIHESHGKYGDMRQRPIPRLDLPSEAEKAVRGKPRTDCYYAGLWTPGVSVQHEQVRAFVLYSPHEDRILHLEAFPGGADALLQAGKRLLERLAGKAQDGHPIKWPHDIWTDSLELYESAKDALRELGIRMICKSEIPELAHLRESFREYMGRDD